VLVPVETNESVFMVSRGLYYSMRPGEVWLLNNSANHAVGIRILLDPTHLICVFLASPALLDLLAHRTAPRFQRADVLSTRGRGIPPEPREPWSSHPASYFCIYKSGGTFVNECLVKFVEDARHVGYHLPRSMVPKIRPLARSGLGAQSLSYCLSWYCFS
jgi:hypothetical protein